MDLISKKIFFILFSYFSLNKMHVLTSIDLFFVINKLLAQTVPSFLSNYQNVREKWTVCDKYTADWFDINFSVYFLGILRIWIFNVKNWLKFNKICQEQWIWKRALIYENILTTAGSGSITSGEILFKKSMANFVLTVINWLTFDQLTN